MIARETSVTWLGRTGVKLTSHSGKTLVVDPPPLTTGTSAVLVSHPRKEILDEAERLGREGVTVLAIEPTAALLKSQSLNLGGSCDVLGVRVIMVPAQHASPLGACGYVFTFGNGYRIYHSGLTALFGDLRLVGEVYRPDLVLLAVGDEVLGPVEAAHAIRLLGVRRVIPMALPGTNVRGLRAHLDELGLEKVRLIELAPGQALT